MTRERIVRADAQGRISLGAGRANQFYLAEHGEHGRVVLYPAVVSKGGEYAVTGERDVDDEGGMVNVVQKPRDPEEDYL